MNPVLKRKQSRIDDLFAVPVATEISSGVTVHDELNTRSVARLLSLDECKAVRVHLENLPWKLRRIEGAPAQQCYLEKVPDGAEPSFLDLKQLPSFLRERVEEIVPGVARVDVFKLVGTKDKLIKWLNPEERDGDTVVLAIGSDWLMELSRLRRSETEKNRLVVRLPGGSAIVFPSHAARLYERNIPAGRSYPISKSMAIQRNQEFQYYVLAFYCKKTRYVKKTRFD
jgi:hypothetical protein